MRNATKHSYIRVVKFLETINRQTCGSVLIEDLTNVVIFLLYIWLQFILSPPVNYPFVWAVFRDHKSPLNVVGSVRKWHQLTRQRQRKTCDQEVGTKISILVINTGPSETVWMRGWQVVDKWSYQLFINSTLKSSCGQLKEKHFCWRNAPFSLAVNKLRVCVKWKHFGIFPFWAGMRTNSLEA